jgi:hypothetical protein
MVYFRGNKLRASTLQFAGEYQASSPVFWGFLMASICAIFLNQSANGRLDKENFETNT